MDDDLFFVWTEDDIDSSFYEDTDDPKPLFVCLLCRDCDASGADVIRGYDPRDGIFERPGRVLASLGGIDVLPPDPHCDEIQADLLAELEADREAVLVRSVN